ncbi:MAG TPA: PKD domain-containing protein [Thermoanaerobaculia bacterium]|jgi:PKD repeat protein|nr:PKD domain-containing protein [Thermoanaerobaculia bacterium]
MMIRFHRSAARLSLLFALLIASGFSNSRAQAQNCEGDGGCGFMTCKTPAHPVPQSLWGELQPVDVGTIPPARDNTDFNEFTSSYGVANPLWMSLDIDSGYLYSVISHGFQIWDIRTTPASPVSITTVAAPSTFLYWPQGELKVPLRDIDVEGNLGAIAGQSDIGITLWDFTNKMTPRLLYQNSGYIGNQVYTTTIGNQVYAFFATEASGAHPASRPGGVLVYNMSTARANAPVVPCLDEGFGTCSGVYVGRIAARTQVRYIDGVDNYVALATGPVASFEIWDVANPAAPVQKLSGLSGVYGVAMWKSGGHYYLATHTDFAGSIYDVSCITGSSCTIGSPIWTMPMPGGTEELYVTYSSSAGRPFLYFGSDNACGSFPPDPQREFLVDVSVPSQAHDITPPQKVSLGGQQIGYWDYYYRRNPTGFNRIMPRMGKFENEYFYRAAQSILDIHKRTGGVAPVVDFDWSPTSVYPGTPVAFSDLSSGAPSSWAWSFQDGSPSGSSANNPTGVTFASTGAKTISLTATNASGSGSRNKTLTVLDPAPVIASVSLSPLNPIVCQPVTFSATGVTGQPTLNYNWQVTPRPSGPPVTTSTSPSFIWNTAGVLAGDFTATLQVQNSISTATRSVDFTLGALSPLPNLFAPTADPFVAGTVQFHVVASGATEWSWDFGDGAGFQAYTNNPVSGPNPVFTYTSLGLKAVRVKVRNCVEAEHTSDPLPITILQISPLTASFAAVNGSGVFCFGGGCLGTIGQAIAFTDDSHGAQFYDYDWDGNGSYEEAGRTTPQTTHTYSAEGSFFPKLRVRRGASEETVFTHALPIIISGTVAPASITLGGASSANINQPATLTASASGCNPDSAGWSWGTGGGTINGGSTASTVSITWTTTGSKTVSASNSACPGASGSRQVTVTDPNTGGGGTLTANFSFTPPSPNIGQAVSFNGTASTGSPTGYAWDFGDGQNASGSTATHSYAVASTYNVTLTVTKSGSGPGCNFGICASEKTIPVSVGGPPPPVFDVNFTTSAPCVSQFGIELCTGTTGAAINFTSTSTNASNLTWSFGDSTPTTTGNTAAHTYTQAGSFTVSLTGTNGSQTKTKTRVFQITGEPTGEGNKSVILPWIAQTRGVVTQSSDLYVFNPSDQDITVELKFLKRGAVEANPPLQTRVISAGATLFVGDVLGQLFSRENTVGFITAEVTRGTGEPVVLSFNNTLQTDGSKFGQTVPGVSMANAAGTAAPQARMYLIGLNDNSERVAYFGLSNPNSEPAVYHLRFFDAQGHQLGESGDLTLGRFGQKQFQPQEIRDLGVSNVADYRVEIEPKSGGKIYPYGTNLRVATQDPAFASSEVPQGRTLFLVGSLSQPGLNNTLYQTDVVLSNPLAQAIAVDLSFTAVGVSSQPQRPVRITLQPGESQRLANVIADKWHITNQVGFLSFQSSTADGALPRVTGESYDNANPARRFGQSMIPQSDQEAAGVGKGQALVGLRQGDAWRTTIWLMNPSNAQGLYDVIYRKLDGTILGRFTSLPLGPGKMKQIRPSEHPLGGLAIEDGFTVQVLVKAGKVLAAGQVINNRTNDPAYIRGETR